MVMLLHQSKLGFLLDFYYVMLFDGVLSQPDPTEELCKLVDPRLGDNYPIDSVRKVRTLIRDPLNILIL